MSFLFAASIGASRERFVHALAAPAGAAMAKVWLRSPLDRRASTSDVALMARAAARSRCGLFRAWSRIPCRACAHEIHRSLRERLALPSACTGLAPGGAARHVASTVLPPNDLRGTNNLERAPSLEALLDACSWMERIRRIFHAVADGELFENCPSTYQVNFSWMAS